MNQMNQRSKLQWLDRNQLEWNEHTFDWMRNQVMPNKEYFCQSIQQNGVLQPLLGYKHPESQKVRIVDGFRRLHAWLAIADSQPLPVLVYSDDIQQAQLLKIRAETLHPHQIPKGALLCSIIHEMRSEYASFEEMAIELLPALKIPASKQLARTLYELHPVIQELDLEPLQETSYEDLAELSKFSVSVQRQLLQWIPLLNVKGNKWKRLLVLIDECRRIQQMSVEDLLGKEDVIALIEHSQMSAPIRYRMLKELLESWRYPVLTEQRIHMKKAIQQLQLPAGVELEYDALFEKDLVSLKISAEGPEQLRKRSQLVNDVSSADWEALFNVYWGE